MGQRGRKKGASGEESRSLLLAVAAEEFAGNGYYPTKVSTIVKKAGLTQPSFYLYFASKEAIFQELVDSFQTELFQLTDNSRIEEGVELDSLPEKITYGLGNIFKFFKQHPNETRIGFFVAEEAENIKRKLSSKITANLLAEQKAGYFKTDIDMTIMAEGLVGMMERLTITQLFSNKKGPEAIAREIVYLLLYGVIVTDTSK